jgi:peptidoglycan/xylan/chitin deacetylase (PgdA/CDA1 family)
MRGHLYCSPRCARNAGRDDLKIKVRESLGRPIPARLAVVIVLLACSAPGVLALRTVAELDRLNSPSSLPPRRAPLARIERVVPGAAGSRIEGTAPAGAAVFLFADGRFAATGLAADGRFRFEGVKAEGPYRVGALPLAAAEGSATASSSVPVEPAPPPAPVDLRQPHALPERRVGDLAPPLGLAPVPDLSRGPRDRREVLVSFDAGSSDRGAREILAALREHRIQTTIFLTGDFIRKYPDLTRRIAADGHEVGNHTETHPHLTTYARDGRQATRPGVDQTFLTRELSRTASLYRDATGRLLAPVWRAPFGEQNEEIRRWAAEAGYWHVGWTGGRAGLDGLDWISDPRSRGYRTSDRVVQALVERAENGGIVLLHLGSDREDPIAPKISLLLDGLSARGFHFAKASEFLAREGMTEDRLAALRLLPAVRSGSAASR